MATRAYGETQDGLTPADSAHGETSFAARSAAALLLIAAALAATLALPQPESPDLAAALALAAAGAGLGIALLLLDRQGEISPDLVFGVGIVTIGLVAGFVAATSGTRSYYSGLYLFVLLHAAVFQPRPRLAALTGLTLLAFLAPLVYDQSRHEFVGVAVISIPAALLGAAIVNWVTSALRDERTGLAEREQEALRLADEDPLTGLANYRVFWRSLQAETARARRHGGHFSLVMLDLDGFKAVNDELGHQAGDRVLQWTAEALRHTLRTEDVLCRQGGDEFAVIAVEAGHEEALELTDRLVEAVGHAVAGRVDRPVSASAGCATFDEDASSAEELVHRADSALRAAKRDRRPAPAPPGSNGEPAAAAAPAAPAPVPSGAAGPGPHPTAPGADRGHARRSHLAILTGLSRALASTRDAPSVAMTAVAHLAGAIDGTGAAIFRWDRPHGELELAAFSGRLRSGTAVRRQPDDQGMLAIVVRDARSVIVANPRADEDDLTVPRSEIAAPVMVGSEVWGALHVVSDRPDAYDSDDLGLAEAIAEQIGRALATVWVIKRLEEARSKEVDWLATAVAPRWNSARRLADLAERVGRRLGLSDAEVRDLRMGGLFHDIGTIAVPSEVLYKRGRLTDEERAVMREHAVIGERVLRRVPHLRDAARIVRHSHERVDGAGYPDGLAGEQIPVASRVLLAVEAFVAMTSPRPYRDPMSREAAIAELRRAAGSQLDRDVVDALVAVAGE